jgi:plasmid replication initiation protein
VLWRRALAGVRAQRGDFEDAERLGREAVELMRATDSLFPLGDTLMRLAEVVSLARRPEEAPALIEEAVRVYDRKQALVQAERAQATLSPLGSG